MRRDAVCLFICLDRKNPTGFRVRYGQRGENKINTAITTVHCAVYSIVVKVIGKTESSVYGRMVGLSGIYLLAASGLSYHIYHSRSLSTAQEQNMQFCRTKHIHNLSHAFPFPFAVSIPNQLSPSGAIISTTGSLSTSCSPNLGHLHTQTAL